MPWPDLPPLFCKRMSRLTGEAFPGGWYAAPPRRGLRVNTLKCSADTLRRCLPFLSKPLPFSPDGYAAPADFKAGADPLHHAGGYYMQEPSAMAAVTLLAPLPGERVLDLCAAPGGKSTQIAAALRGTGLLWSNEYVPARTAGLLQNLERCGVRNGVVSSLDTAVLCSALEGFFDAVLADLPCSGEGMFRKEPASLTHWSLDNIRLCAARGASILDAAATAVRPGGRLMISTCTFAPEENECQVAAFLSRHPEFTLLPLSPPFGQPGYPFDAVAAFAAPSCPAPAADLTRCRRIFPVHGGEGHFLALLQKTDGVSYRGRLFTYPPAGQAADAFLTSWLSLPKAPSLSRVGQNWFWLPDGLPALDNLPVLRTGVWAAVTAKNRLEPTHSLFMAYGREAASSLELSLGDPRVRAFLRGEPVEAGGATGFTAVLTEGIPLGFGKASGGILKNRYPKGLRLLG